MPDAAPSNVSANASSDGQRTLTPAAVEAALAEFRDWLLAASSAELAAEPQESEPIDLHTLLSQFLALRHEVNLQTRANRAQQEQNGAALEQLGAALDLIRQGQSDAGQAQEQAQAELLRPLLKALIDVHDALSLAAREVQRVSETLHATLDQLATAPMQRPAQLAGPETAETKPTFWSKWFGTHPAPRPQGLVEQDQQAWNELRQRQEQAAMLSRQLFDSLLTGYRMSLQRIERVLEQQGLEPIDCAGQPFDPELMEAVAVVSDSARPPGQVVEEVRRGYQWRGRLFRYAQVSVAKR
jgi:molecular chaperone GrpE